MIFKQKIRYAKIWRNTASIFAKVTIIAALTVALSSCVSAQELFEKGVDSEKNNQTLQAENYYTASIQADSNFLKSYNNRGLLYLDQGRYIDAAKDFDTALTKNPNYSLALVNRGLVEDKQGNLKSAYSFYQKATVADPKLLAAQYNAAKATFELSDTQKSIQYIDSALSIDSKDASVRRLAGRIYFKAGQYNKAYQFFKALYEDDSNDEEALISLIEIGRRAGKLQEAIRYAENYSKSKPTCINCTLMVSSLYLEDNRNDSAISVIESAIDRMPNDASLRYRLGLLYTKKGDNSKAIAQLQEFLKLSDDKTSPDIETAKALIATQKQ